MGAPVRLCNALAPEANSASIRIRVACRPYAIQTKGGYAGGVTIENTTSNVKVSDANATWTTVVSAAGDDDIFVIDHPLTRIRVAGSHTGGGATVDLIENY